MHFDYNIHFMRLNDVLYIANHRVFTVKLNSYFYINKLVKNNNS